MNPFFFGSSQEPLYGVHHPPPAGGRPKDEGIVLCYPFGQEYMRAHRAFRQLALLLTKKGYHVLRFDYRGTGDSSLNLEDVSAGAWTDDVGLAVEELRDTAGVSRISVVGLRLGALISAVACASRSDVERLVLWDPILSGKRYQEELLAEIAAAGPDSTGKFVDEENALHFNGFAIRASLREELDRLSLADLRPESVGSVLEVVSHSSHDFTELKKAWESLPGFQFLHAPAPHDWNFVDGFGGILLPQPIIQAIVGWFP